MLGPRKPTQKPALHPRTCRQFLDEWEPRLKDIALDVILDFSFALDGVTATDMRSPSALRTRLLYKKSEIEARVDREDDDFVRRIGIFMGSAR